MNSKECEEQLKELIEAWNINEALLNQTDINAIKHLMLENQMQQDTIKTQKIVINNLSERIKKAVEKLEKGIFIIPKDTDELLKILKEEQ